MFQFGYKAVSGCPSQAEGVKSRTLRKHAPSGFTYSVWMSNVLADFLGYFCKQSCPDVAVGVNKGCREHLGVEGWLQAVRLERSFQKEVGSLQLQLPVVRCCLSG